MNTKKIGDFIGYSNSDIHEAIKDALNKAGEHSHFEIIESQCSQANEDNRMYKVTLATFAERI